MFKCKVKSYLMNKTVSVYFSGTGFSINDERFLASSLFAGTKESESQIKMGFNGCAVDYGFNGAIFGSGLDEQSAQVINCVMQEIKAGHQVTLNIYGHSRGGIAALLLAKQLGNIDNKKFAMNLALLDPVPGNLITTSKIDPFRISLATKTMDLSDCKSLKKVLALYPHIPLSDIQCHAPLLISYPKESEVQEEVVGGCHAETEQISHSSAALVRLRVEEFLVKNGTQLQTSRDYYNAEATKRSYLLLYQEALAKVDQGFSRKVHSAREIVITTTPGAKYLNDRHKALEGDNSQEPVALSIQSKKGFFSWCNRFFRNHPFVAQATKWTFIALSLASLVYFTGGLAAIPFLVPIVTKLGALSLLAFSPVMGGAMAALWYGAVKPLLSWCASKFFYPHYATRKIEVAKVENPDSTRELMNALGVAPTLAANAPTVSLAPHQGKSPLHSAITMVKEEIEHDSENRVKI
jgi:hypothetical protein